MNNKVYPRVGGETLRGLDGDLARVGLSPRGRGNPTPTASRPTPTGSIPAWAGKPLPACGGSADRAVYPRVGGETIIFCTGSC